MVKGGKLPTRNARHIVNPTSLKMLIALITRNMHVIMAKSATNPATTHSDRDRDRASCRKRWIMGRKIETTAWLCMRMSGGNFSVSQFLAKIS